MSTYSNHHQFCASQAGLLDALIAWLWTEPDTLDVDCVDVEGAGALVERLDALPAGELWRGWVVSAADAAGWTSLWGTWGGCDEALVRDAARARECDALYGHDNDQVDNWRWIRYFAGVPRDQYWYTGQLWYRDGRVPPEAMTPGEAFASMGRTYVHESFSGALSRALHRPAEHAGTRVLAVVRGSSR